jgi:hypothetical protein
VSGNSITSEHAKVGLAAPAGFAARSMLVAEVTSELSSEGRDAEEASAVGFGVAGIGVKSSGLAARGA